MRREYEVMFIVRLEGDESAMNKVVDQVRGWIEADELGQVTKIDRWGRRKLAYEIRNQREGYYVVLDANIEPRALAEIEVNLNLSESILRYIIVRKDE